ncbi:hypothetical protein Clacol_006451 [Clathrus columnatus]|uniref:Fungal-type protein kinase domain-containing protein n=1 Tax=Clathrus columnatus TaxID=1419009 RepID=A0AAV5ACW3_9AGAM|nr:hypothetical protein Clacol_006451 [Clathrus columnatus]
MEDIPAHPHQPPAATVRTQQNQATPLGKRASSIYIQSFPCTSSHVYRGSRTLTMAREVEGHIAGPMTLRDFVEKFLPLPSGKERLTVDQEKRASMKSSMDKVNECKNSCYWALSPKFIPYDTHAKPLRNFDQMTIKPDICFYDKKHANAGIKGISAVEMIAKVKYNLNDDAFVHIEYVKTSQLPQRSRSPSPPVTPDDEMLTETTLFVDEEEGWVEDDDERKGEGDDDKGKGKGVDNDTESSKPDQKQFEADINRLSAQGRDTLGQITTYTVAQKAAQFRKHIFSLLIFKGYGRILFWDWSGIIVTERFRLTNDYFAEFFWRYNKAKGGQRGHDETIGILNAQERNAVSKLGLFDKGARLVKILVGQGNTALSYVVEQPNFMGGISPFGRSTRGFIAYSLREIIDFKGSDPVWQPKRFYLKDTWRIVHRHPEHEFYDKLHAVKYVATYCQASDVPNHETTIQRIYQEASGALGSPNKIRHFQHYRIVLSEVGTQLTTFRSTRELVSVIHQALQAHQNAYDAGVLHRDISVGNIIIRESESGGEREALLIDWDMAKFKDDNAAGTMERTQFLAARFLRNPEASQPNFDDDLESFVYVLTWVVFCYTDVNFTPSVLYDKIYTIFNKSYLNDQGIEVGGDGKVDYLQGSAVLGTAKIKNKHLNALLKACKDIMAYRYDIEDPDTQPSLIPQVHTLKQRKVKEEIFKKTWLDDPIFQASSRYGAVADG